MKIQILEMIDGARKAEGLTVIIDVFRAFSLECYLTAFGAASIHAVGSVDDAMNLKTSLVSPVLIGERGGAKIEGFDFGNSPYQVSADQIRGSHVIHTTSAGTQGVYNAVNATEIISGSLVNAKAVAAYILERKPSVVSLVAMGKAGKETAVEDVLCAEYIRSLLLGQAFPIDEKIRDLRRDGGTHFFNPDTQEIFPEGDFWFCTKRDIFPFILRMQKDKVGHEAIKVPVNLAGV